MILKLIDRLSDRKGSRLADECARRGATDRLQPPSLATAVMNTAKTDQRLPVSRKKAQPPEGHLR